MSITASFAGHTCNNLFQYAVLRIIAEKNGYDFYIPEDAKTRLREFVDCDMGCDSFTQKYEWYETPEQKFDPELFNIKDGTYIHGFFQTHKYLKGNWPNIVNWFYIPQELNDHNVCLIHFRGKDYVGGWNYLPKSYYEKAMAEVSQANPDMIFKVVTDDPEAAREYFPDKEIQHSTSFLDFQALKSARHLILSNSSYSCWAPVLTPYVLTVIAPKRWFNYNKNYDQAGLGKTVENNNDWYPYDMENSFFTFID